MAKESKAKDLKIKLNQSSEERAKALETAISQIEKQFGKGAVMRLGQNQAVFLQARLLLTLLSA